MTDLQDYNETPDFSFNIPSIHPANNLMAVQVEHATGEENTLTEVLSGVCVEYPNIDALKGVSSVNSFSKVLANNCFYRLGSN